MRGNSEGPIKKMKLPIRYVVGVAIVLGDLIDYGRFKNFKF